MVLKHSYFVLLRIQLIFIIVSVYVLDKDNNYIFLGYINIHGLDLFYLDKLKNSKLYFDACFLSAFDSKQKSIYTCFSRRNKDYFNFTSKTNKYFTSFITEGLDEEEKEAQEEELLKLIKEEIKGYTIGI